MKNKRQHCPLPVTSSHENLHYKLGNLASRARDEAQLEKAYKALKEFLTSSPYKNHPDNFLDEARPVGRTHFMEALYLPYHEKRDPHAQFPEDEMRFEKNLADIKALKSFELLKAYAQTALEEEKHKNDSNHALNPFKLKLQFYLTSTDYNGSNLLHHAVATGNADIVKSVFEFVKGTIPKAAYQEMLMQSDGAGNNLLHIATANAKNVWEEPNPFVVNYLTGEYFEAFRKAKPKIDKLSTLLNRTSDAGNTPTQDKPEWLLRLLDKEFHYAKKGKRHEEGEAGDVQEHQYVSDTSGKLPPSTRFR